MISAFRTTASRAMGLSESRRAAGSPPRYARIAEMAEATSAR